MEEHIKLIVGRECDELALKFRSLNEYLRNVRLNQTGGGGGNDLELRTKKEDVFMQNNRILFYRNVHSMIRALQNNIFNFRKLSIKTFETYPTFKRIFINFMRSREFINKNALQQHYQKIAASLTPEIEKYLLAQPLDEEFEGVIADMTLANFNNKHVDTFVSKIFQSSVSEVKQVDIKKDMGYGHGNGNGGGGQPNHYGYQDQPFGQGPNQPGNQRKDLNEMNDEEFEDVLDDFIKSLKDV